MLKVVVVCLLLGLVLADVQVNIELNSESFARGDELMVNWRISTEKPILSFLRWGTPLEGEWNSNMFLIQDEQNNIAEYQGRIFKRATPQFTDYHILTPKSALEGSLPLSEGYKFYNKGTYSVTLRIYLSLITGETLLLESNTVSFTVTNPDRHIPIDFFHSLDVGFTDCSATEKNVVNAAIPAATTASDGASAYMNQTGVTPSCDETYETWFGTYTSSRWNKVQTDFAKIHSRLQSRQFNINCGCKQPGTYAYVYPSDPTHTIYLCPVFWDASSNAYTYNSQPGTLTHEMSHFNDVAGTGDYQYGVPGCLQLASDSPNVAVDNADSHEFFQESKPVCN